MFIVVLTLLTSETLSLIIKRPTPAKPARRPTTQKRYLHRKSPKEVDAFIIKEITTMEKENQPFKFLRNTQTPNTRKEKRGLEEEEKEEKKEGMGLGAKIGLGFVALVVIVLVLAAIGYCWWNDMLCFRKSSAGGTWSFAGRRLEQQKKAIMSRSHYRQFKQRLLHKKVNSRFDSLFRSSRFKWVRSLNDLKSEKMKRKIFGILDMGSKIFGRKGYPRGLFQREYGRAAGFALAKIRAGAFDEKKGRKVGIGRVLRLVNEYSRKYYRIDLRRHKKLVMFGLDRALKYLPGIIDKVG